MQIGTCHRFRHFAFTVIAAEIGFQPLFVFM